MLQVRQNNMFFVCVTVGLVMLASKYRKDVLQSVKQFCHRLTKKAAICRIKRKGDEGGQQCPATDEIADEPQQLPEFKISLDKVILVDSLENCDYAIQRIRCNMPDGILGFDCEWVDDSPVALLQIATTNGVCVLFRLGKIGSLPTQIKELLSNTKFLKVGVGSYEDGRRLTKDYGCKVEGTVDLRVLADSYQLPNPKSLAALCLEYLGFNMEKIIKIRCSNWDAETLTEEQIVYASSDALASALIYQKILQKIRAKLSIWEKSVIFIKSICSQKYDETYFQLPKGVINIRFKAKKKNSTSSYESSDKSNECTSKLDKIINRNSNSEYKSNVPARTKPLYHNCYLQAPDGETLCTCDRKKAEWYVSKGLGKIVEYDPLTVKLAFEPSGRAEGAVGQYYTQVKLNQCVVCGASDQFIRKNVVPKEYRKYFPVVMKSHQSHDVLLLCPKCHEISSCYDSQFRKKLAEECNAPLSGPLTHVKGEMQREVRMFKSAIKVLRSDTALPPSRKKELEQSILKSTGYREMSPVLLNFLQDEFRSKSPHLKYIYNNQRNTSSPIRTKSAQPHGMKVVQYYENHGGGLVELEKLWREHFLHTMKPKFLPELWSVDHNQERLSIRQIQNRILPEDAKLAGIKS